MTEQPDTPRSRGPAARSRFDVRRPEVRAGAVVVLALMIGFGVWLAVRGGGSSASSPLPQQATAVPISAQGLQTLASSVKQPIYWAGPRADLHYELTRAPDGRIWIRYLPQSEKIGEASTPYLTVGTYPVKNAFAATESVAKQNRSTRVRVGKGGIAFYSAAHPTSVYLAYPHLDYQIEVFDPDAAEARKLVASGQVDLAPGSKLSTAAPRSGVVDLDEKGLKTRIAAATRPVYWVGPERHVTYELTKTANGRAYVRYLPAGVKAGSDTPYLTVGTYPLRNALAATKAAAKSEGSVTIDVGDGGFGFYSQSSPSNVHLAYPGKGYQIEIFDPSPQRAHELASSGRLRPVG